MKHPKLLFTALSLTVAGALSASAETQTNYTVNFDEAISTSAHDFRVATNWKHIVGTDNYDSYGPYYMSYSYYQTYGVDGSGCLKAGRQYAGDNYGGSNVYDLLVTPEVQGTISLQVKTGSSSYTFLEFYTLNESGSDKETLLQRWSATDLAGGDWKTVTVDVADSQRIGIRASEVYIDNFTASSAEIELEPAMSFVTVVPEQTTGVIYHNQNADGDVELIYTVSVKNTGQTPLVARKTGVTGTKNYSISIIDKNNSPFGAPVYVPYDLAIGETSPEFEVKVVVPRDEITSHWSYSSATIICNLRENLQGTIIKRANAGYKPYESKFAFCKDGAHSSSSITNEIPFGICTGATTVALEIYNGGNAPLKINSITLPAGFTTTAATGESSVASMSALALPIAIDPSAAGYKEGNLEIKYLDNSGSERTHTVYLYGTVVPGANWTADFGSSKSEAEWPDGAFAEQGVQTSYGNRTGSANMSGLGTYDNYLYSYTNSDYKDQNNKFITPLLTSATGAKLYYSVATDKTTEPYDLKIYLSSDRKNWGEPVATYSATDAALADGRFHQYAIDLPAGDTYVGFAIYGMKLNDLATTAERKETTHDIHLLNFKQTEKQQSGKSISASVDLMSGVAEEAGEYRVMYYLDNEKIAQIPGTALTASATTRKGFNFTASKEVETTTTFAGKIVVEFEDGTLFETDPIDITITNEPAFVFGLPGINDGYNQPSNLNVAIDFGKTNTLNTVKKYEIFNWGTAPLQVTSVTMPEGFSANIENATVAGKTHQPFDITFSATTPGTYSGSLSIKYMTAEGEKEYTQEVKGILLDPAKWYATFDGLDADGKGIQEWPAGSVYQKNLSSENIGSTTSPNYDIYTTSGTTTADRMFVTPLLKAETGDILSFDAKIYSTGWKEGGVKVFAAATRDALLVADAEGNYPDRTLLTELCGKDLDEEHTLTTDFTTFSVTLENAGEYYIGFEPYSRCHIDEIYGLKKVAVAHDWLFEGSSVPIEAMQNIDKTATVKIRNVGTEEPAGTYTVTAYVDGLATETAGAAAIPAIHKLSDNATEIAIPFRSPKAGTFPVKVEVKAGDTVISTDPVEVTFAEETASGEITIGEKSGTSNKYPLYINDMNSESLNLFTSDYLKEFGLKKGDKIASISMKGYGAGDYTTKLKAYYLWVDEAQIAMPTSNSNYDTTGMIEIYNDSYNWQKGEGTSTNLIDILTLELPEPTEFQEGKSLLLFLGSYAANYKNYNWEVTDKKGFSYAHYNDGTEGVLTGAWEQSQLPVMHLGIIVEPKSIFGTVENGDGEAVENAVVTLISNDGDNIQYTATTGADGAYNINVIQNAREYDVEVKAGGKEDFENGISFATSVEKDFTLLDVIRITDDGDHTSAPATAVAYLQKSLNPGFNAVAFPMALTKDEVEAIFGEDVIVLEFDRVTTDAAATVVNFNEVTAKTMEAGTPYLIFASQESREVSFKTKGVMTSLKTASAAETDFLATEKRTPVADKMFVLNNNNFTAATKQRAAVELPAYSGYIKAPNATSLTFTTDADIETGIEEAVIEMQGDDNIYDLNGIRVKNPEKGIYIINGKAVIVK